MNAILRLPVDTADLATQAYGRKPPHYRVIMETCGLAVVLMMNGNIEHDHAAWLAHPDGHDALCEPAEQFAQVLTGKQSPQGWRAGALASLRTLAGDTFHEATEPWPWTDGGGPDPVKRIWVDDTGSWDHSKLPFRRIPSPLRTRVLVHINGRPRVAEAWEALWDCWDRDATSAERRRGRGRHAAKMAAWSSTRMRPASADRLRADLLGEDPDADPARWMLDYYRQRQQRA
jgi:hypothetical protein